MISTYKPFTLLGVIAVTAIFLRIIQPHLPEPMSTDYLFGLALGMAYGWLGRGFCR